MGVGLRLWDPTRDAEVPRGLGALGHRHQL